jgi:hypothetical protein
MFSLLVFITAIFVLSWLTILIVGQAIENVIKTTAIKNFLEINAEELLKVENDESEKE